ncbi:hypothetical protein BDN71DRAFT_1212849 [Pleurotus eryngii]|uniref:Uncharacterized protein n=1 Tax=Pleurotus eryngii TaxID=5323 RepID=A0A9P5ZQA7_PLEER|nr:hypothetical protein BDN71DRAFT_1212849 [Pleurotus eryngii]
MGFVSYSARYITFLSIPARRTRVSTEGEVYCIHNRLAVKFLSTTTQNLYRFFRTCDGCNWQHQHPRSRGWIWQDEVISALRKQVGGKPLAEIVEATPPRVSPISPARRAQIHARFRLSRANPAIIRLKRMRNKYQMACKQSRWALRRLSSTSLNLPLDRKISVQPLIQALSIIHTACYPCRPILSFWLIFGAARNKITTLLKEIKRARTLAAR